jgi:hypothetical protein
MRQHVAGSFALFLRCVQIRSKVGHGFKDSEFLTSTNYVVCLPLGANAVALPRVTASAPWASRDATRRSEITDEHSRRKWLNSHASHYERFVTRAVTPGPFTRMTGSY